MCKQTKIEIIKDINDHLSKSGRRSYSEFYIGITNDIERRFKEHRVQQDTWWIYRTAIDAETARDVENYYTGLGMQGHSGGGSDDSDIVYCYAITSTTIE